MHDAYSNHKPLPDESSRVCVLFDPGNGRIVHVHGVTRLEGVPELDEAELEARARRHAEARGRATSALQALHVPVAAIRQPGALRVTPDGTGLTAT